MPPTVTVVGTFCRDNLQTMDERCNRFVVDVVDYAMELVNRSEIPRPPFVSSDFTCEIRDAMLRSTRSRLSNFHLKQIVVTCGRCVGVPKKRSDVLRDKIAPLLCNLRGLLESDRPRNYFLFFKILGALCNRFFWDGKLRCILMAKEIASELIFQHFPDGRIFRQMNAYARCSAPSRIRV